MGREVGGGEAEAGAEGKSDLIRFYLVLFSSAQFCLSRSGSGLFILILSRYVCLASILFHSILLGTGMF